MAGAADGRRMGARTGATWSQGPQICRKSLCCCQKRGDEERSRARCARAVWCEMNGGQVGSQYGDGRCAGSVGKRNLGFTKLKVGESQEGCNAMRWQAMRRRSQWWWWRSGRKVMVATRYVGWELWVVARGRKRNETKRDEKVGAGAGAGAGGLFRSGPVSGLPHANLPHVRYLYPTVTFQGPNKCSTPTGR